MAANPAPQPRRGRVVAVGDCVARRAVPGRRRAAELAALAHHWREIAGPLYARWSAPERLAPSGRLRVLVEGPFAVQMQHLLPALLQRIAVRLGEGRVTGIGFRQGCLGPADRPPPETPPPPDAPPPLSAASLSAAPLSAAPMLTDVADPALAAVLARLAAAVEAAPRGAPVGVAAAPLPSGRGDPISRSSPEGAARSMDLTDREKAFEASFARDAELQFKVNARANRLAGHWAARRMKLTEAEADAYARSVVQADFEEAGDADVVRKLVADLEAADVPSSEIEVRQALDEARIQARQQLARE